MLQNNSNYPPYIEVEKEFNRLWEIDDESCGFYGFSTFLKQIWSNNLNHPELYLYFGEDLFKFVYNNSEYEGVFLKSDYNIISLNSSLNNNVSLTTVMKNVKIITKTNDYILFQFKDDFNCMNFKLNKRSEINVSDNMKTINNQIYKSYLEGIQSRKCLLEKYSDY